MRCREGGRRQNRGPSHDGKVCTQIHLRIANAAFLTLRRSLRGELRTCSRARLEGVSVWLACRNTSNNITFAFPFRCVLFGGARMLAASCPGGPCCVFVTGRLIRVALQGR
jgi:hypothetical protein